MLLRQLKVSYALRHRASGIKEVPYIPLNGIWLENLGFKVGERIQITEKYGELTLKIMEDENKESDKK